MSSRTGPLFAALALVMGSSALADSPTTVPLAAKLAAARAASPGVQLSKGMTEYGILGNFRFNDPSSQDISFRYAPMLSEHLQWGVDFSYHNDGGNSGSIGGILNFYPGKGPMATHPYIGAAVGTTFGDMSDSEWGFQGGVKHFVSPNVAVTGELQYRRMGDMDWSGALIGVSYFGGTSPVGQDFALPVKGTREFDISGRFNFDDPEEEFIEFLYGMFLNRNSEVGVDFSYDHISFNNTSKSRGSSSSDFSSGFIGGVYNYHFSGNSNNRALPYVGAHVGTTFGDGPNTASYGAQLGIKYFLTKTVAFRPEFVWTHFDRTGSSDDTGLRFGLAFFMP